MLRPEAFVVVDELPADPRKASAQRTRALWKMAEPATSTVLHSAGFIDLAVSY